ncbi:MAG: glycerol-3-phosphate 1-O-acyltransferase PlsY [Lysobacter sp.]|nr:glycerol-3-phosphate 1-O-acyltransferase PlsY [Lysobacter sp.]
MPLILLVASYLIGSLSGSLLLGKLRGVDIRTIGSGNAGGTNALRTQGIGFALVTVVVDVGKGMLAVWMASNFMPATAHPGWVYGCALAAITGHVWPVFHGFRGGKGAATLVGGLALIWPAALLTVLVSWLLVVMLSGYVGLATVLAGGSLLVMSVIADAGDVRTAFAVCVALLLVYTHRANLSRLRAGTEPRFERVRLLARWLSRKRA